MGDAEVTNYRLAFNRLDVDNDGKLNNIEVAAGLRQFGKNPSDEEVATIMNEVDEDKSGTIEFEEFCELAKRHKYILLHEASLKATYSQMDKDSDGNLTKEEFFSALRELGRNLSDEVLDGLFNQIDQNGDGLITYEEFEQHWLSQP